MSQTLHQAKLQAHLGLIFLILSAVDRIRTGDRPVSVLKFDALSLDWCEVRNHVNSLQLKTPAFANLHETVNSRVLDH